MTGHIKRAARIFVGVGAWAFLLMHGGCESTGCRRFDPALVPISSKQVIYYGNEVKDGLTPIETVFYGQLGPGASGTGGGAITMRYNDIFLEIFRIKEMGRSYGFDAQEEGALNGWSTTLEQKVKADIARAVDPAGKSADGAKNLAAQIEPFVKTAGSLEVSVNDLKNLVPAPVKSEFEKAGNELVNRFNRLYQTAVASAQSLSQNEAILQGEKIRSALTRLEENLQVAAIITNVAQAALAQKAVTDASIKLQALFTYASKMTTNTKVAGSFTQAKNDLVVAIALVKSDYVDAVDPKIGPETTDIYNDADEARKALIALANDYFIIEDLKNPPATDARLVDLVNKAFLGDVTVPLGMLRIDQKTDLNRLEEMFRDNNLVVIAQDSSSLPLVRSLASAYVYGVGQQFGPKDVDNIVGPNHHELLEAQKVWDMTANDFKIFLKRVGKEIREQNNKNGAYKNIFVVFADGYAGADVSGMVEELLKDKGRVLVITANPTLYPKARDFGHDRLNVTEGVILANAIIKEQAPHLINPQDISKPLVTGHAAFEPLTIGNLRPLVISALARMPQMDVTTAVLHALADRNVPTAMVLFSGVFKDDIKAVHRNLEQGRDYYVNRARFGDTELRTKEAERNREFLEKIRAQNQDAAFRRDVDANKNSFLYATKRVGNAAKRKRDNRDAAVDRVAQDIDNMGVNIHANFVAMENAATNCLAALPYINNPAFLAKFSNLSRWQLLDADFVTPVNAGTPSPEMNAALGKPNLMAPFDNSWASCLIFGGGSKAQLQTVLDSGDNKIANVISDFKNKGSVCLGKGSFYGPAGIEECLVREVNRFEDKRKVLAFNKPGQNSLLEQLTASIDKMPEYNAPGFPAEFWKVQGAAFGLIAVGNSFFLGAAPLSLGVKINNVGIAAGDPLNIAYRRLNSLYYLRALLDITGTSDRSIKFDGLPYFTEITTNELGLKNTLAAGPDQKYVFYKPLLANFDDRTAKMIETRRVINDQYHFIVANSLTQLINEKVIKELRDRVVNPFWDLPLADLRRFQEGGAAGSAEKARKDTWDRMTELGTLIQNLGEILDKPLIVPSNGNAQIGNPSDANTSGLMELGIAYQALFEKIKLLQGDLNHTTNVGIMPPFDPAIQAKIRPFFDFLNGPNGLVARMDLGQKIVAPNQPPWAVAVAPSNYLALPALATIAKEFMAAFEAAYDLHIYNYFDMQNVSLVVAGGGAVRNYPVWHSKTQEYGEFSAAALAAPNLPTVPANVMDLTNVKNKVDAVGTQANGGVAPANLATITHAAMSAFGGGVLPSLQGVTAATTAVLGGGPQAVGNAIAKEAYRLLKYKLNARHPLEP